MPEVKNPVCWVGKQKWPLAATGPCCQQYRILWDELCSMPQPGTAPCAGMLLFHCLQTYPVDPVSSLLP